MIHGIVIHFFDLKHGLLEGSGFHKVEAHTFVATDINYQATRFKAGFLFFKDKINGVVGVLKGAIDKNTGLADQFS